MMLYSFILNTYHFPLLGTLFGNFPPNLKILVRTHASKASIVWKENSKIFKPFCYSPYGKSLHQGSARFDR
ncbi:MAG: hypothetical protein ACE1ZO_00885, partial [Nitrospirales bacterium]